MSHWNKIQGVEHCTNCGRAEHLHVWVCVGCDRQLSWKDALLPVDCVCGSEAATLCCPTAAQPRVTAWVCSTFGEAVLTNVSERALRLAEEALELTQACGLDAATLHRLVDYVFGRPVGEAGQEVAGCMVTLYAVASALGVDADAALEMELTRIQRPEIVERCRRRQAEKRAAMLGCAPNRMDAENGPECACGRPSACESGWCGTICGFSPM